MRIALVDTNRNPTNYPIALLKIGAWRADLGDECVLFDNKLPLADEFDEIWLSTVFTYDIPYSSRLVKAAMNRAKKVKVGGIAATLLPEQFERFGAEVHRGLVPEAEECQPDYDLLGFTPDYSITNITRGCIRKCEFCMVKTLEPKYRRRHNWVEDLHPTAENILFYDNNWSASNPKKMAQDADIIRELAKNKRIRVIDFNQGLDCRVMTEEKADIIKGLPLQVIRFAFDSMDVDGYCQRAITMMAERGFHQFRIFILYNFEDTPKDTYFRMRECCRLSDELKIKVEGMPMRYHSIDMGDFKRAYTGINWTKYERSAFKNIIVNHSPVTTISCYRGSGYETFKTAIEEFEYWFGRDADEFVKLINYPKIRLLCERKRGNLRIKRAMSQHIAC